MSILILELIGLLCLYSMIKPISFCRNLEVLAVEHIPKEIKKFLKGYTIVTNIFRIQEYDSAMCGYVCIVFIVFMLKGKSLTDFTNLFSPNDFKEK